MVPIQTKMVDVSLLDDGEKEWLNAYHQKCLAKLRPLLEDDERALRFLESSCALIE
ncbi:hypothetical protein MHBO_001124 [Bonamia ostreae]|uniref:Peptidase M24 C-terminal domain-containing protein n=1 Tax=Bonamia ostreae TaxID=126728 RepID=A0ABV2AHV5_9EUKA